MDFRFNVSPDHWLAPVSGSETLFVRMPLPGGSIMETRRALVIHFTSGSSGLSSVEFWKTPAAAGACAHVVIERDGGVIQCRPFDRTCGHAGKSHWRDPKHGDKLYSGLNAYSIGIELANSGDSPTAWARRQPGFRTIIARHKNGGSSKEWEAFYDPQIAACRAVAAAVVTRYNLDDIVGHDDIAPDRKNDPGPAFPMKDFREALGFAGLPRVYKP